MDFELLDLLKDDVEILEIIEVGVPRKIYERKEYFHFFDELFYYKRFRLTKEMTLIVLEQIETRLECPFNRNSSIAPINQLLVALRFFATGSHLLSIADFGGMHISTVSRIVLRVSTSIAALYKQYIKFPTTSTEIARVKREFYNIASFPSVIGAVDGTHIKIQSPSGSDPDVFRNRKGYFSINVQATCAANMVFTDIVARWPGSTHDATIFSNSRMKNSILEGQNYSDCVVLGDSAYPQKVYLMTPLLSPQTTAEHLYNESQIRSRGPIEKAFGILKRRFPVLAYGCSLKLNTALTIIVAACVLHNILRQHGEPEEPPDSLDFDRDELQPAIDLGQIENRFESNERSSTSLNMGMQKRANLINNYFGRL